MAMLNNQMVYDFVWLVMESNSYVYIYISLSLVIIIWLFGGLEHFFHNIWDNPSHWSIFFRGVETANQMILCG